MSETTEQVVLFPNQEIGRKINESVSLVVSNEALLGFEKAYLMADAIKKIKENLTPAYMKPIMELQGNNLGFKTDKDKDGGYSESVVKNCLVEAVLMGVQPYDNQFNIIAGNCYLTKNGIGYLLKKLQGLVYDITFELPRVNSTNTSAAVLAKITWNFRGNKGEKQIEIPIKMNQYMGTDAVIGKATRKARKWLYDFLTGSEIPEGDVSDADFKIIDSKPNVVDESQKKEIERIKDFIANATTLEALEQVDHLCTTPDLIDLYNFKKEELSGK